MGNFQRPGFSNPFGVFKLYANVIQLFVVCDDVD